jgi:hypothetical protein
MQICYEFDVINAVFLLYCSGSILSWFASTDMTASWAVNGVALATSPMSRNALLCCQYLLVQGQVIYFLLVLPWWNISTIDG